MIIAVTGSVCTGKTRLAKLLAKKYNLRYIDLNLLIKKNKLYSSYNKNLKTYEIDTSKLVKFMINWLKDNHDLIIDSHLSHYIPPEYIDICYITKCSLKELRKRLKKRNYSREKIAENLEAEIMDICLNEAKEIRHNIKVIDTTKSLKSSLL